MMYFKVKLSNGSTIYFDAIDFEAGHEYGKYKAKLQGAEMETMIVISKKNALFNGLSVDETK